MLAFQLALLCTAVGQSALCRKHPVLQLGVVLLGICQLHVQRLELPFGDDTALLQLVQLVVNLGHLSTNLGAAATGLVGQLSQTQRLNL